MSMYVAACVWHQKVCSPSCACLITSARTVSACRARWVSGRARVSILLARVYTCTHIMCLRKSVHVVISALSYLDVYALIICVILERYAPTRHRRRVKIRKRLWRSATCGSWNFSVKRVDPKKWQIPNVRTYGCVFKSALMKVL